MQSAGVEVKVTAELGGHGQSSQLVQRSRSLQS